MRDGEPKDFLDAHLNVAWLRPESALWDTIASSVVAQFPFVSPSLDLGSGNGLFSFITAGGAFTPEYDWYRNTDTAGFWENRDIYDTVREPLRGEWISRKSRYEIDCALDFKHNLLRQAQALRFYKLTTQCNANASLPFQDESFQTVFSNMLYWLESKDCCMKEIWRVLRPGGCAILCLQDTSFQRQCLSYQWQGRRSELLRLINRGRSESVQWAVSYREIKGLARRYRFKIVAHSKYLSPLALKVWDIGLRPLSPVLINMIKRLSEGDRLAIKLEWIATLRPLLVELCEMDRGYGRQGGYHCVCLEKV